MKRQLEKKMSQFVLLAESGGLVCPLFVQTTDKTERNKKKEKHGDIYVVATQTNMNNRTTKSVGRFENKLCIPFSAKKDKEQKLSFSCFFIHFFIWKSCRQRKI